MTREEVAHNNPQAIVLDGFGDNVTMFDSAILGLSTDGRVVYSVDRILRVLRKDMSEEAANDWLSFNILGILIDRDNDPVYLQEQS